jgi:hypothetical protein
MATGAVGAAALTFAVLPDTSEARIVGAALIAFATGWAMLAWLTTRMTTRPQRWAYVPATFMAASGTTLLAVNPGEPAMTRLLDSASPHQVELVKPFNGEYQLMRRALAVAPTLFRFGVGRMIQAMTTPALPGAAGEQVSVFANSPRGMAGLRAEQAALPQTFRQAQALTTLGTTPLVVLTAQDNVDHMPGWGTAQNQLAALSTNTRHTVANLDHVAFLTDPAGSALSITAITDVVTAVRTHNPSAHAVGPPSENLRTTELPVTPTPSR